MSQIRTDNTIRFESMEIAELEIKVAEALRVPCAKWNTETGHLIGGGPYNDPPCRHCGGSGRIYPLRTPCRGYEPYDRQHHFGCSALCTSTGDHVPGTRGDPKNCQGDCQGRGWVFNRAQDAVEDAIRAKGWFLVYHQGKSEDLVRIYDDVAGEILGLSVGQRGHDARILALARALGLE